MQEKIEVLTETKPVFAGEYFRAYNDLPSDACIGERDISVRELVEKVNELIRVVNALIDE